ncbi:hypothetical protein EYF80_027487 [Liparis tanakae]|uniref:DUF4585 domain-containing protein n=1 Tax=Liparis tanakae TaxID=230148 RepID=A0A4Z2HBC3_9TELE|nr:hypothetical protein EYF80_027487 [Liparis tanakae]
MEAAEETLTYRDDTLLNRKLLPEDKHGYKADSKGHATETKSDESNYVDLDMKPNGATTGEVTLNGEDKQLPVIKCDSSNHGEHEKEGVISSEYCVEEQLEDRRATFPGPALIKLPYTDRDSEKEQQRQAELDNSDHVCSESDELQYTDMYLNSKSESDDGASAVLSDHCSSDTVEDESHYITTHEIQLTELDHDVDYDLGRGTCWDFEDDNLVFSFVDYASFESDETQTGTLILKGRGPAKVQSNLVGEVVSTEQEDSDLCDSDKCASSDESLCKNHIGDANAGEIHVSIKTSSRTVNEPVSISDNTCGYTKHFGDGSHFSFVSSGVRAGPFSDGAQYFIPAPGRQHLASKLRRKDINEYSSGGSSSISELDDADKEVRNLTAKSFRSLACPYFDAINLRTSRHYYLVDTPIQATTKRLFDPETGQYVDVPMSHSSVAPVTPLPLSLSPLTLSAGAYAPTYMIYPGFISPTLQAQAVLSHSPCHSEDAGGERAKTVRSPKPDKNAAGGESAYYSATDIYSEECAFIHRKCSVQPFHQ